MQLDMLTRKLKSTNCLVLAILKKNKNELYSVSLVKKNKSNFHILFQLFSD
jgi:hypothetical protein